MVVRRTKIAFENSAVRLTLAFQPSEMPDEKSYAANDKITEQE
jgi:hypothetical protein